MTKNQRGTIYLSLVFQIVAIVAALVVLGRDSSFPATLIPVPVGASVGCLISVLRQRHPAHGDPDPQPLP